jgi:nucleoid-associated protein YgaU
MTDTLAALVEAGIVPGPAAFPPGSRYHAVPVAKLATPAGEVAYVRRRFVPQPEAQATLGVHTVTEGDRLDLIAARELGDPLLFWRLCEANGALRPEELLGIGRRLRIALPEGMPGTGGDDP